jgi:hypothetical protein
MDDSQTRAKVRSKSCGRDYAPEYFSGKSDKKFNESERRGKFLGVEADV